MQPQERIYFDNAATTPIHPEVVQEMIPVLQEHFGNPSSTHGHGRVARMLIEKARKQIAQLLGASTSEIFFTSGGTESDNMAIRCAVEHVGIRHIITSRIEHHAVLHTVEELSKYGHAKVSYVKLLPNGHVDLADLERLLAENARSIVSLMHGNNEIGNLLDLNTVGQLCNQYNALFHSDTVQTIAYFPFNLAETPIDFVNGSAHKFNGPKGVGFIYVKSGSGINAFIQGGSQERNMRGGTENIYGIVGMAKAMQLAYDQINEKRTKILGLKQYMIEQLKAHFPNVTFNGDAEGSSLYTVLNVSFPPSEKAEMLLFNLDIAGISASGGSACTSGSNVGSHVLAGIGADPNRPAVRFSFGAQNTKAQIDFTIAQLKEML